MKNCILIVDDDPTELRAMEIALKEIGVDVCCADSAANARILMDKIKPDLILTDVMMPIENGFEFCSRLKNSDAFKAIPVIFLTGLGKTEHIVKGFEVGGDDYLLKPIALSELHVRVKNHLKIINLQTSLKIKNQELKQAKDALRKNDYLLSSHLLNTPVGAIFWDRDFNIVDWNPAAEAIFGYPKNEAVGRHISDLIVPDDMKDLVDSIFQDLISEKGGTHSTNENTTRDGRRIVCDWYNTVLKDADGTIIGLTAFVQDITDRKLAEEKLKKSEEKYRTILETIEEGYYEVDMAGNFTFFNDSMCRILGYPKDELIGLNNRRYMDDENAGKVFKVFNRIYKTGHPYRAFDWELIKKDGSRCYVETSITLKKNLNGHPVGFQGIVRDITDRKLADMALQASHKQFLTVLDGIDATIYVVDMKTYEILFMNKHMKESFGRDYTGELCWQVFRNESRPCLACPIDKLCDENGKPTDVFVWSDKNPVTGKWYINHDRAIEWTDGRWVKLQIATDITDLKKMEEELRQARKRESIGTLTSGIAHEFNNIMGIIVGNTELSLEDVPESNPVYSNLEAIKTASRRATNIIKQLSNLSRTTDQKLQPIKIARTIKDAVKSLGPTIADTITIQQDIHITDETILADPFQINQVITNLCINAFDAMEKTGGNFTITAEKLSLDNVTAKNYPDLKIGTYIKLVTGDTGPGISPEIIDRIFDPYFTTKGVGKGSGMGLALVHSIVKSHGGAISVNSTPGKGTKFTIFFPLAANQPMG